MHPSPFLVDDPRPRDIDGGTIVLVRRDNLEKAAVRREELVEVLGQKLSSIEEGLYERAGEALARGIQEPPSLYELGDEPIIRCGWCGEMDCAEQMEKGTDRTFLGFDEEAEEKAPPCLNCGRPDSRLTYLSRQH